MVDLSSVIHLTYNFVTPHWRLLARETHPATPHKKHSKIITLTRFRLIPVRSPLLGESRLISSPRGTEMFQFPRYILHTLCIQAWIFWHYPESVLRFGDPRIKACLQLPGDYRSLPRPSSSTDAKASTICPYSLDHINMVYSDFGLTLVHWFS